MNNEEAIRLLQMHPAVILWSQSLQKYKRHADPISVSRFESVATILNSGEFDRDQEAQLVNLLIEAFKDVRTSWKMAAIVEPGVSH